MSVHDLHYKIILSSCVEDLESYIDNYITYVRQVRSRFSSNENTPFPSSCVSVRTERKLVGERSR